ncbi:MAG: hypothetical protein J5510_08375 [Prevotella sp.]|nr:hypothetical protein [Prevotella sp.]
MKLEILTGKCYDAITESIKEAVRSGIGNALASVNTNDGYIELYSKRNGSVDAYVYHDDKNRYHDDKNFEAFLSKKLDKEVDWYSIEEEIREERESYDIWDDHGFNGEDDYRNWKG